MTPILIQVQPYDVSLGGRINVLAADALEADAYGLGGLEWKAAIAERPILSLELMSMDLDGKVQSGKARFVLSLNHTDISLARRMRWAGSPCAI